MSGSNGKDSGHEYILAFSHREMAERVARFMDDAGAVYRGMHAPSTQQRIEELKDRILSRGVSPTDYAEFCTTWTLALMLSAMAFFLEDTDDPVWAPALARLKQLAGDVAQGN